MNVLLYLFAGYLAVATVLAVLLRRAPMGYEDSNGFHDGNPPVETFESESLIAKY